MVSDGDLVTAIVIALALLAIALCVWPGYLRVRARSVAGYWATPSGALYHLRATGPRSLTAQAALGDTAPVPGHLTGVRGLRVGGRAGSVELGARRIVWAGGAGLPGGRRPEPWTRQGVTQRFAVAKAPSPAPATGARP